MVRITTWEIANLDFAEKEYGCTLRELLMSLCSSQENRSHIRLFHAVEERYWSNEGGHVFVVLPQLADEARPLIAGLLTLLRWYVLQDDNNVDPKHLDRFLPPPPSSELLLLDIILKQAKSKQKKISCLTVLMTRPTT